MKISIRVKVHARKNGVMHLQADKYLVSVTAPPVEGKANEMVIELLAEYFGKPRRCISIVRGIASKEKIVELME